MIFQDTSQVVLNDTFQVVDKMSRMSGLEDELINEMKNELKNGLKMR